MYYQPFWTPLVIVFAVLSLMVVPFLSLIAFMIGLVAAAIALGVVGGKVVAALYARTRPVPWRAESGASQRRAVPSPAQHTTPSRDPRRIAFDRRLAAASDGRPDAGGRDAVRRSLTHR
jgi:hypothetical protein